MIAHVKVIKTCSVLCHKRYGKPERRIKPRRSYGRIIHLLGQPLLPLPSVIAICNFLVRKRNLCNKFTSVTIIDKPPYV